MQPILLFFALGMEALARKIAAAMPGWLELGVIRWDHFRDGTPNFFIEDVGRLQGRRVVFLAHMSNPAQMLEEIFVLREFPLSGAHSLKVVLPYYATATMERADTPGQIVAAKSQAELFRMLGSCHCGGPPLLTIFDPHTLSLREFLPGSVVPQLKSAASLLGHRLTAEGSGEEVAIVFPDGGAAKRFKGVLAAPHRCLHTLAQIVCEKVREGDNRIVRVQDGDPKGKHVVILDDLIQTGGTIIECANALRDAGACRVSAYATHGIFPEESWRRFTPDLFHRVWITDSCPVSAAAVTKAGAPFEVLSLTPLIIKLLAPTAA